MIKLHPGPGDGNVHAAQVTQKTDLTLVVGTHHRDEDDVAFLSLEAVNGIDGDEPAEGLEEFLLLDETAQILHLGAIGRDDAHVNLLIEDALLANLRE